MKSLYSILAVKLIHKKRTKLQVTKKVAETVKICLMTSSVDQTIVQ